jgi:hypothetical protein
MKRTAFAVGVGAVGVGAVVVAALTGCSISISAEGQASSPAAGTPVAAAGSAAPVSPAAPSVTSPGSPSAGATYMAFVGPVNAATFALDAAVLDETADLTTASLSTIIAASAASIQTFNDHLRRTTWPRTAEPDITTLAATNDVLVVVLQGYESELQSPAPGADFHSVLDALQVDSSRYATDRGLATDAAARVRADLGLPPPSAPQVTLND